MARITVQRQCWQRWPRVLIAERRNDDGTVDERRYVPEGGTENEWKARCRDALKLERHARDDYEQTMVTLQGEFARAEHLKAEADGLKWAIEERDALIRDLLREAWVVQHDDPFYAGYRELGQRPTFEQRARELGIETGGCTR